MSSAYAARFIRLGLGLLATVLLLMMLVRLTPGPELELGVSIHARRPVADLVGQALPITLGNLTVGLLIGLPLALLVGLPAGLRPNSLLDRALQGPAVALAGVPAFTVALLVLRSPALESSVLSLPGALRAALVLVLAAWMARAVRQGVAAARQEGTGLSAGKAVVGTLGRILQQTGNLLVVTMLVETTGGGPAGIGRLLTTAAFGRDIAVVYGALWAIIPVALLGHLAGDLLVTAAGGGERSGGPVARGWVIIGGVLVALLLLTPLLGNGDAVRIDLTARLQPPGPDHPLGTDQMGRDLLNRIGFGARISLTVALAASFLAAVGGGLLAGVGRALGRWGMDILTPRITVPGLLAPLVGGLVGALLFRPSLVTLILALGIASIPAMGMAFRHLAEPPGPGRAPGTGVAMLGLMVLAFAQILLAESALGFFGFGVMEPTPSLGSLVGSAMPQLRAAPYLLWGAVPGALGLAGLFLLGHGLAGSALEES